MNEEERRNLFLQRAARDRIEQALRLEGLSEDAVELGLVVWPTDRSWGDPGWSRRRKNSVSHRVAHAWADTMR